ncbi:MAG TPA: hypothetical protein VF081_08795 [Solirubrobacterales bacterium]
MSKRTFGLLVLCALSLSAFAAQSASAITGTTAFTCKETGAGDFTKAHCKAADAGAGKFSHVVIPQNTTTEITGTNEKTGSETTSKTVAVIQTAATSVGIFVFEATGVSITGSLTNKVFENGEHYVEGPMTMTLTGVTASSPPGCKIAGGKIESVPLIATSAGQGMELQLAPKEGAKFFEFTTESCSNPALNTKGTVTGSTNGTLDGATLTFTEAETTAQKSLKVGFMGMIVGFGGSITLSGRSVGGGAYTPLSYTTVQT